VVEHKAQARKMRSNPETGELYPRVPEGEEKIFSCMGGGSGSGKGTTQRSGQVVAPPNAPVLNADDGKEMFSEFIAGKARGDRRIASFVHDESSSVVKRAMADSLEAGENFVLDGTGDGGLKSIGKKIRAAREKGYKTVGNYTTCSVDEAVERAIFRELGPTGRGVPDKITWTNHRQVSRDFLDFKDLPDFYDELFLWDTSVEYGKPARLVYSRVGGVEKIHDRVLWERFKAKANVPDWVKPTQAAKLESKLHYEKIKLEIKELGRTEAAKRRAAIQAKRMRGLEDVTRRQVAEAVVSRAEPQEFVAQLGKAIKGKHGEFLSPATEKVIIKEKTLTFLSPDGKAGYALTQEGDFRHAFNMSDRPNTGPKLLDHVKAQVAEGETLTLDAFEGVLTDLYEKNGFIEVSRMKWDDAYAPKNWNYERFGRPDVVNMEYTKPVAAGKSAARRKRK
jgi:predicted ABC-type ATPase